MDAELGLRQWAARMESYGRDEPVSFAPEDLPSCSPAQAIQWAVIEIDQLRTRVAELEPLQRAAWAVRDSQPEGSVKHQIALIILGEA